MLQNENAVMPVKVGDTLTGIDSRIQILAYDPEADAYTCDIFNISGDLIGAHRIVDGGLIRACVQKRERTESIPAHPSAACSQAH